MQISLVSKHLLCARHRARPQGHRGLEASPHPQVTCSVWCHKPLSQSPTIAKTELNAVRTNRRLVWWNEQMGEELLQEVLAALSLQEGEELGGQRR